MATVEACPRRATSSWNTSIARCWTRDEQYYRNRIKYRNSNRNIYQVLESKRYWYCRLWFFGIDIETEIEGCELRYRNWYCYCRITFAEPKLKLRKLSLNWIWNQVPQFQYHRKYQSVSNAMHKSVEYLSLSGYLKTHEMIHTGDTYQVHKVRWQ